MRRRWLDMSLDESISPLPALIGVGLSILLISILAFADPQTDSNSPAILQIRILDGEGAVYHTGSRATRGLTIQVTDETGKPVDAARVSFRLPDSGPGGTFASGGHTEIATTRSDGRAGIWGMQWNRTPGPFEIKVTAEKGPARAGTVTALYLSDAAESAPQNARMGPGHSHRLLWIAIAVGGAAAAGVAATAAKSTKLPPGPTTTPLSIGTPSITLGHP
jgi:hypothetical protein